MSRWQRHPEVLWRRSGARRVLNCPSSEEVVVVDGSGSLVWDLLTEPVAEGELTTMLSEHFDVDEDLVRDEVVGFLDGLHGVGAVVNT